jgi:hypothetical protein
MQPQPPIAAPCPTVFPHAVKVTVRHSRGDGSRTFIVDTAPGGSVAEVKRLLCPCVCSDASALELVLKGEGAASVCDAF